jgi:hypothetical protein
MRLPPLAGTLAAMNHSHPAQPRRHQMNNCEEIA